MFLGLFPELTSAGGIQRIGRQTAAALSELAQRKKRAYHFIGLNDPPGEIRLRIGHRAFLVHGCGGSRIRLLLYVAGAAFRTELAYLAHPHFAPLGLLLKALRPNSRYWVAGYGIDAWDQPRLLERIGLRRAYGITALSEFTQHRIASVHGISPQSIELLAPAVDPIFTSTNGSIRDIAPTNKTILCVARLTVVDRYKGVDNLIRAMPSVAQQLPDARLVVVGDGDDRHRLESLSRQLGMEDRVEFLGSKNDQDLRSLYRQCDVFAMPSLKEGMGIVFLEAMAFGKPVIGGRHGGTPEIVRHEETGLLVDHDNVAEIARALIRLLVSPELRVRLGQRARDLVADRYTYEHLERRLEEIIGDSR